MGQNLNQKLGQKLTLKAQQRNKKLTPLYFPQGEDHMPHIVQKRGLILISNDP